MGSGIQAGSSIGSQAIANTANKQQARKQREWNERMWGQTNDWNEKMWHMQNQYNSPEATMQRYRDAGLNPNLVVGEGAIGGGQAGALNAEGVSGYDRANIEGLAPGGINPIEAYLRLKQGGADIENKKTDTELKRSTIDINEIKAMTEGLNYKERMYVYNEMKETRGYRNQKRQMELQSMELTMQGQAVNITAQKANIKLKQLEAHGKQIDLMYQHARNMLSNIKSYREIKMLNLQEDYTRAQYEQFDATGYLPSAKITAGMIAKAIGAGGDPIIINWLNERFGNIKQSERGIRNDSLRLQNQEGATRWGTIPALQ